MANVCRPFFRVGEIAKLLNVTEGRVYQLIRRGQLPATRVGGRVLVPRDAWLTWLERKKSDALNRPRKVRGSAVASG